MNDVVKAFLSDMRQLRGFQEFLKEAEKIEPPFPRYKSGMSTEQFGADTLFASGAQKQQQRWVDFLMGGSSQSMEE